MDRKPQFAGRCPLFRQPAQLVKQDRPKIVHVRLGVKGQQIVVVPGRRCEDFNRQDGFLTLHRDRHGAAIDESLLGGSGQCDRDTSR